MRECGDDFGGGVLADLAVAIVNAALRERVRATARTGFRVELVQRDGFLFGRELGEIDAWKFAGAFGVLQKNLAGVLKGFHFDVADGQAEKRTNFGFVENGIAETFMFLNDAALRVQNKRSGKRGNAAVLDADFIGGKSDGIVDAEFFSEHLDGVLIVVVNDESKNLESVFVFFLELDKIGNFSAAGSAPSGPEIQQDDFSVEVGGSDGFAVEAREFECRRGIRIADKPDRGLAFLLGGSQNWSERQQQATNDARKRYATMEIELHGVIYL